MKTIRSRFIGLTSELEGSMPADFNCRCDRLIDVAMELRNMLKAEELALSRKEKVDVVKMLTRAKVKAFMLGTPHSFDTFRALDSISSDVIGLL
ncbi:MAG: hypothetical protein ABII71_06325 [Candidatus Micrarchaeota archaeon]